MFVDPDMQTYNGQGLHADEKVQNECIVGAWDEALTDLRQGKSMEYGI